METKEKKKRKSTATIRKSCERGTTTQKMVSFRCDMEVYEELQKEPNKGRLINILLKKHYEP